MPKFYQKIYNTQTTFGSLCFIILFLLSLTNISLGNSWLSDDKPTTPLKRISKENKIKTSISSLERNNAPDAFIFTVNASKDTVSIGETVEIKIRVSWVDYAGTAVHFLPEWYKYALKVVMPKGFIQTGGDYEDYCTKPVNEFHPEAVFTIKGHFEYKSESTSFRILRGFEGANANSEFIFKQDFNLNVISKISGAKVEATCSKPSFGSYKPIARYYCYTYVTYSPTCPNGGNLKKETLFLPKSPSPGYLTQWEMQIDRYKCEYTTPAACISEEIYGDTLYVHTPKYLNLPESLKAEGSIIPNAYEFCTDYSTFFSQSSSKEKLTLNNYLITWSFVSDNKNSQIIESKTSTIEVPVPSSGTLSLFLKVPLEPENFYNPTNYCAPLTHRVEQHITIKKYEEDINLSAKDDVKNLLNPNGVKLTSLPCRDNSNILLKTNQLNSTASNQSNATSLEPKLYRNNELVSSITPTITDGKYVWSLGSANEPGSYSVYCQCAQSNIIDLVKDANCLTLKPPYLKQNNQDVNQVTGYSDTNVSVKIGCPEGNMVWSSAVPSKDDSSNDAYWLTIGTTYKVGCIKDGCSRIDRDISTKSVNCDASTPTFVYSPSQQVSSGVKVSITGSCTNGTFKWDDPSNISNPLSVDVTRSVSFGAKCIIGSCSSGATASINVGCNATPPTFEYSPNNFPLKEGTGFWVRGNCSAGSTFSWNDGATGREKWFTPSATTRVSGRCTSETISGCFQDGYLDIPVNQRIAMSLKLERQNAICGNGKCDGKILATITNRENKYTYTYWLYKFDGTNWQPQTFKTVSGNTYNSGVSDQGNSIDIRELSSGQYKVVVRDYQYGADDPRDGIEETIDIAAVPCPSSANFSISTTSNCIPTNGSVAIVVNGCQNGTIDWWRDLNAYGGEWIANPFNPNNVTVAGRYKAVCSTAECPKERNDYAFSNAVEIIAPANTKPILLAANNKTLVTVPELTYNLCTTDASGVQRDCQQRSIYYQYNNSGQLQGINDVRILLGQGIGYFASSDANLTMPTASRLPFVLGESVTLMANGCPNGTYRWSNGETGSTITLQPTANTPIYVQCYSGESCTSQISNTIFLEKTSGNFEVSSAAAAVCSGAASTVLTAKGCENSLIVRWFKVGEANTIGTGKTLSVTPTQSAEYYARCYEATKQLLESNKVKVVAGSALGVTGLVYNKQSIDLVTNSTTIRPCTNAEVVLEAKGCEGVVRWATLISNKGSGYTFPPSEGGVVYNTFGNETDYADIQGKSGYSTLITKFTTNQVVYVGCAVKNASATGYQCTQWKAINVQLKGKSQSTLPPGEYKYCEGSPLSIALLSRDTTDRSYSLKKIDVFGNAFEFDYRPKKAQSGSNTQDLALTSPFNFEKLQIEQTGKWRLDIVNECGVASKDIDIFVVQPPINATFDFGLLVKKLTVKNNSSLQFRKIYKQDRFVIPQNLDEQNDYSPGEPGEKDYQVEYIDTYAYWTIKKILSDGTKNTIINGQQQTRLKSDLDWATLNFDLPDLGKYEVTVDIRDNNTMCVASYTQVIEAKCQAPAIPIKPANADKFSCIGTNTVTFSATGCNQAGQVLKWYQYNPQASNVNTLLTATGNILSISTTGMAIGTYMYRSKCVQESCESDFSEKYNLTIGANTTPVANAVDPKTGIASQTLVTAIQNRKVALSMTGCEYGNVNWYRQGNANILASGNTISVDYATVGNVANQEFAFYGQCVSGVAPNTCTSANSNLIKVKFIACPAVANIIMTPNATSVCGSVVLGASGGDNVYVWKNAVTGVTLSSGDAFKVESSGGFYYESCGARSNTVNITVNQVKAEVDGPVVTGNAIGVRELLGGTTPTYQWRNTAETTGTVLGTASSYTPTQAGDLFVWVTKGSCTTGPLQSQAYAQGANCNIDFATGTQGVAVSCDGGMATLTLKHNLTTVPAGAVIEYRLDLGAWSTDAVIRGVPYGKHTVSLRYTNGTQICYATRKLDETAFDACGKLACDDLYIAATDSQGLETYTIPRDPATKGVKSLVLKVASFSEDPLNGLTYQWERVSLSPNAPAFTSTQASISIAMPGTYKVTLARGTSTCSTLITIGASPCNTIADPATRTCTTSALTGVADEAANRLTDLAAGDVVQAGDFNITITEVTGTSSGWNGKGYVTVPYLNAQVNIVLQNAVFNDCYQLTNANSSSEQPTVFTVYDPNWGSVVDVEDQILNIKNSIVELSDLIKTYTGTPEEKAKIDELIQKISAGKDNPNLIPELKIDFENKVNLINSTWNETKNCTSSSLPAGRLQAMSLTQEVCNINTLVALVDEIQNLNLEPQNLSFPELNIPSRCNTDILTYWKNVLQLKTTTPEQYSDPTGFNWNITQYTLYDTNWKTNKKWWWIKEVCSPDNCANKQMYVYSPKYKDYILFYDKQADCDGNMQSLIDLADGIGNTYSFVLGTMLGGPEDLAFEYGVVTVKYLGTTLNIAQKTTKAKNIAKAVAIYVKESKLAKAAGRKVDDIKTWWGKLLQTKVLRLVDEIDINNLQGLIPTGAKKSLINASNVASNALKKRPFPNSSMASKVDNYISAVSSNVRGEIGETIAEDLVHEMDGFLIKASKLASDNGMDIVAIKGTGSNMVIRIIESKPMNINNGAIQLGETVGKGTQMSDRWLNETIDQMRKSTDLDVQATGNILFQNFARIERYVMSVDKSTKEIILLKLNPF